MDEAAQGGDGSDDYITESDSEDRSDSEGSIAGDDDHVSSSSDDEFMEEAMEQVLAEDDELIYLPPLSGSRDQEANGMGPNQPSQTTDNRKHHLRMSGALLLHFSRRRPRHQNVLTEFADGREFVLSGDAMVIELLGDRNYDASFGGQFLHLVYLCERFLLNYIQRGGVVCVVFFDDLRAVWRHKADVLLAREAVRCHLACNSDKVRILSVANPWSAEFHSYLEEMCPTFGVTSDCIRCELFESETAKRRALCLLDIVRLMLLSAPLNLAYISGAMYKANTVVAFFQPSSSRFTLRIRKYSDSLRVRWECIINAAPDPVTTPPVSGMEPMVHDVSSLRSVIGGLAAAAFLNDKAHVNEPEIGLLVFIKCYVLHVVLMDHTPLEERCHRVNKPLWTDVGQGILQKIQIHTSRILPQVIDQLSRTMPSGNTQTLMPPGDQAETGALPGEEIKFDEVADLMDGRFLTKLLVLTQHHPELFEGISDVITSQAEDVWRKLVRPQLPDAWATADRFFPFEGLSKLTDSILCAERVAECRGDRVETCDTDVTAPRLLPIKCPLVSNFVGDLQEQMEEGEIEDPEVRSAVECGQDFDENYHWHSGKELRDDYENTKDQFDEKLSDDFWVRRRQIRSKQKLAEYTQWYGATLGGGAEKTTIVKEKPETGKKHGKAKGQSKKAREIVAKNEEKRQKERLEKELLQWKKTKDESRELTESLKFDAAIAKISAFQCEHDEVRLQTLLEKMKAALKMWKKHCTDNPREDRGISIVTPLMVTLQELCREKYRKLTSKADSRKVAQVLANLGFVDLACTLEGDVKPDDDGKIAVGLSAARFLLVHMGHDLPRVIPPNRDPRVKNFIPDDWQREMLDIIDRHQSALIVAPTSSGKTYASYYCIEKVLRESDDGVLVYVAPTKALVNQVAATVFARYDKTYRDASGRSVHGVFTRDYRTNALRCQVLITVPECLEILMLSPRRQQWVSSIKYVIFDEVHCLGKEEGAEVWEHLLLMIRCPFVALSATIENPGLIQSWLQKTSDLLLKQDDAVGKLRAGGRPSYKVQLVVYKERYSDLEKYLYLPQDGAKNPAGVNSGDFVHYHPIMGLTRDKVKTMKQFPETLEMSAKETVQLFDAMRHVWPGKETLEGLDPDVYFGSSTWIQRQQVREYERCLKDEFLSWKTDGQLDKMDKVIRFFSDRLMSDRNQLDRFQANSEDEQSQRFMKRHLVGLVDKLNRENRLPALIFSFNRRFCEVMVDRAVNFLSAREAEFVQIEAVKRLMKLKTERNDLVQESDKKAEEFKAIKEKHGVTKDAARLQSLIMSYDERIGRKEVEFTAEKSKAEKEIRKLVAKMENVDVSEITVIIDTTSPLPLPRCTYVLRGAMSREDVKKVRDRLRLHDSDTFSRGIKRGILWHHSGNNNKLRSSAEILFRQRHVQVVAATGTLALGIHMPCKSVVFAGDSPFLDSLQYRQMAGRSGRRGYDNLGQVFFFGLSQKKINHLMSAKLPNISGNFPVKSTLILRLFLLCNTSHNKELSQHMALSLLSNPLMSTANPLLQEQLRHFFLFATQFLMRMGLLDEAGMPQGLAGLVSHLHYHEPANFVFVDMLRSGALHDFCSDPDNLTSSGQLTKDALLMLITIVANLFGRHTISERVIKNLASEAASSKVLLPPLPEAFEEVKQQYNARVRSVFNQYMVTASRVVLDQIGAQRTALPMSAVDASPKHTDQPSCPLTTTLAETCCRPKVCSVFAAMSGNTDEMVWTGERNLNNLHVGVYSDESVLPVCVNPTDNQGRPIPLSGYMVDYLRHGSQQSIVNDFCISMSDVFTILKEASLTIKAIAVSLEQLGPEKDCVVSAFLQLRDEFQAQFNKDFNYEFRN